MLITRSHGTELLKLAFALLTVLVLSGCSVATAPSTSSGEPDSESQSEASSTEVSSGEDTGDDSSAGGSRSGQGSSGPEVTAPEADERSDDSDVNRDESQQNEAETPADPVRLKIDALDVDAHVERVGTTPEGAMDVPREWDNVGWYEPGTAPGEPGNSVIAGHYDSPTSPAVFYELGELEIGDRMTVTTEDYEELVFEVTEIEMVEVDNAPLEKIFGSDTDQQNLNLITCDGVWDAETQRYESRLVVYTTLVSE